MMPSRGCSNERSSIFLHNNGSPWNFCVAYLALLSLSYILFLRLPDNITFNSSSILVEKEHSVSPFVNNVSLSPPPPDFNVSDDDEPEQSEKPSTPSDFPVVAEEEAQLVRPPTAASSDDDDDDKAETSNRVVTAPLEETDTDRIVPTLATPPEQPPTTVKLPAEATPQVVAPVLKNDTVDHHDDIPSFSEWAKKQMAEVEKKGENLTVGTSTKMRLRNHASPDCGAKVVAANPEALSAGAILSPSRDDYMLNPCNVKIWFVVELCEVIQPQRLEIANFELFSSSPQDMSVYVSDRFPTRDWRFVATVQAKDERTVQSFSLPRVDLFAKYVKVELLSHYGSEHYCPVSLFKAFGTSELEILDNVDNSPNDDDDEASLDDSAKSTSIDDEEERALPTRKIQLEDPNKDEKLGGENLFGTAKNAVVSFMKKAAEVLVTGKEKNRTCSCSTRSDCQLPGGYLMMTTCDSKNEQFCRRLCTALSCQINSLSSYLKNSFVNSLLSSSPLCSFFGFESSNSYDDSSKSVAKHSIEMSYLRAFLTDETLAALCHVMACSPLEFLKNNSRLESPVIEDDETLARDSEYGGVVVEPSVELTREGEEAPQQLSIAPTKTLPEENSASLSSSSQDASSLLGILLVASNDSVVDGNILNESLQPSDSQQATAAMSTETPTPGLSSDNVNTTEPQDMQPTEAERHLPPPTTPSSTSQNETHTQENGGGVFGGESSFEAIFSDITDEEIRTVNPNGESSATKSSTVNNPPVAKESVFVRLANRIKALEVNISLSSQYLEELSRRYKRQVEELQRSLSSVIEERRLLAERETLQMSQIAALTTKVESLSDSLAQLLNEQNSWSPNFYVFKQHGFIIAIELVMLLLVVVLCGWLTSQTKSPGDDRMRLTVPQRRHSMDEIDSTAAQKSRRPSEEAFVPSSGTHQELLKDPSRKTSREARHNRRKRRRKDLPLDSVPPLPPTTFRDSAVPSVTTLTATGEEESSSVAAAATATALTTPLPAPPPSCSFAPPHTYHPDLIQSLQQPPSQCQPPFFRTAQWSRKQRMSTTSSMLTKAQSSSGETINSLTASAKSSPSPSKKKAGAIKKIVKKFF